MLQGHIQQTCPQIWIIDRTAFPKNPGRIEQAASSRRNGRCNLIQNGKGIDRTFHAELILMEKNLVAQKRKIGTCRGLKGNYQIAPAYGTRHSCNLRKHVCLLEGNMRSDPERRAEIEMSLAIPNSPRSDRRGGVINGARHHQRFLRESEFFGS